MIRQAISCDICGAEKKQTNHWFVAYETAGELRVSGWSSRNRLRAGSKHLCGQACLHKLADEFVARTIARRLQAAVCEEIEPDVPAQTDTSLTSPAATTCGATCNTTCIDEFESSARLITPPEPVLKPEPFPKPAPRPAAALVPMPDRGQTVFLPPLQEAPRYISRDWRAEAWERERDRMSQAPVSRSEHRPRRLGQA